MTQFRIFTLTGQNQTSRGEVVATVQAETRGKAFAAFWDRNPQQPKYQDFGGGVFSIGEQMYEVERF